MSDQKNTPEAGSPLPETESAAGTFPDLSAHTDSPAWLSRDGNHDAGIWERSFDGAAGDGDQPAAGSVDVGTGTGGATAVNAEAAGDGIAAESDAQAEDLVLPPEPVVMAPEELELEEPSLAEPTLGDDVVEAASLKEVASETAAVEADAAEAGRLSGLEPAPAGARIPVNAEAAGTAVTGEAEAEAVAESGTEVAGTTGTTGTAPEAEAAGSAPETEAAGTAPGTEAAGSAPEAEAAGAAPGTEAPGTTGIGNANADRTDSPAGARTETGTPDLETAARTETAAGPDPERDASGKAAHPLDGINAAAPLTGALQEPPAAADAPDTDTAGAAAPRGTEPTAAAIPPGGTRRSRRLAESQAAGAAAARGQNGKSPQAVGEASGADGRGSGSGTAAGSTPVTDKDNGKTNRNTRLLLVIGGVVLAAVVAILLFVFVFNNKEEGVISENVSPVDLESGACLQDWDDVNSSATVVTCETPHDAQLVATDSFTEDASFPGTSALEERVNEVCDAVDYADAAAEYPDLKLTKSIPTEQTWSTGDRRVDCFVFAPEGQELTESLLRG